MLPESVATYLADHRQQHLDKLLELLAIPSIANRVEAPGQADPCRQAAEWLVRHMTGLGLAARIVETPVRPAVIASAHVSDRLPTLLIYGHYDVQPPDPLDPWTSPPFEPALRDGAIYARGASDDKGQLFAHLMAVEAWQRAGGGLPVNLRLLFEGQEEIGSPGMAEFLAKHKAELSADAVVISDAGFYADGVPSITYALRGVAYGEVKLTGPSQDLHSGLYGGLVANPINALARLIAQMHDDRGRVALPGFYDDVQELSAEERRQWADLPFDEAQYAGMLGLKLLAGGEKGLPPLERLWARPTLDCNGILGGYTGVGSKTVLPSTAMAKITMRLVSGQDPAKIAAAFRAFVAGHTPPGMTAEVSIVADAPPVRMATDSPSMRAAKAALQYAFGRPPAMIRCGASVPITDLFQRVLGLDPVVMGLGLPTDNLHGPNEHFRLSQLWNGSRASAALMQALATGA